MPLAPVCATLRVLPRRACDTAAAAPHSRRRVAIEKGMHLSEYCVKSADGERLPVTCEEDVYRHLGMKYQQPHERTSA